MTNQILSPDIKKQMHALATQRGVSIITILEEAMQWYVESQSIQMLAKQLPNGSFRVATLHPYGMCIEHITKRIIIDSFKDIDLLLEDGYYPISQ